MVALGAGLAAATIGAAVVGGFVAAVARAVVTPDRKRTERVPIHAVDPVARTVTIERTADTELQGRYSLWFGAGTGHMRVGEVLGTTDTTVTRASSRSTPVTRRTPGVVAGAGGST